MSWPEIPLIVRFMKFVDYRIEGCWEWRGSQNVPGYGGFRLNGKGRRAHRVAYELAYGAIPEGLELDHLCRNPSCVRPEHLEPVTRQENALRWRATLPVQTHCKRGHPYEGNSMYRPDGRRSDCRVCASERQRQRYKPKSGIRGLGEWQKAKARCPKSHAYDETNTRFDSNGGRSCKKCNRQRQREYRQRVKEKKAS